MNIAFKIILLIRHMKEQLEEEFLDLDAMDNEQLLFTYFRTFDLDKDGKIDGLEMMKAILRMNSE